MSNDNPIQRFQFLWDQAQQSSAVQLKSAVCVSSIDENGYPQARFVDLKQVDDTGFVFCTDYQSAKGQELLNNPKTTLTIWWEHLSTQVRVTGTATAIHETLAQTFWRERSYEAQLTTLASQQSQPLQDQQQLAQQLAHLKAQFSDADIPKPEDWGGFLITPIRIEFLLFKADRMHHRDLYIREHNVWQKKHLQP